jgi:RNA polymerase sigma factor (sigma-70 family)
MENFPRRKTHHSTMSYYSKNDDLTFTPLTPDEEKSLFESFHAGVETVSFRNRKKPEPPRDIILQHHLKLGIKIALSVSKGSLPEEDAISAANLGIMTALESKNFDPARGVRFSTYVRHYIRSQVLLAIRFLHYHTEKHQATEVRPVPFDAVITGAGAYQQNLENPDAAVDHDYENSQLNEVRLAKIRAILDGLPPLEAYTVTRVELEGASFADVGREKGVSREAARKAHGRAIPKLRESLTKLKNELL